MANTLVAIDNLLAGGTVTLSSSSTTFLPAWMYDGRGSRKGAFLAAAASDYVRCDLNDPGLDGFEAALGWTDTSVGASNTATRSNAQAATGTYSMKLTYATAGASNYARGQWEIADIPAGQRRNLTCSLYGDDTLTTHFYVYIPECGLYLDPTALTWGTTPVDFASRSTGSWAAVAKTFAMPSRTVARRRRMTLRFVAYLQHAATTGAGYVDDVYCWPSVSFIGVHGHNLGPVGMEWRVSDNAWSSETTKATLTIAEKRFFAYESTPADNRYQEIILTGTNHEAAWFGELAFCQALALTKKLARDGYSDDHDWPQTRPGGSFGAVLLASESRSEFSFPWEWYKSADHLEWWNEVYDATQGGRLPCWIVPLDDEALCVFGNLDSKASEKRKFRQRWSMGSVKFVEQPHVWDGA